jgi:hypothetical protein
MTGSHSTTCNRCRQLDIVLRACRKALHVSSALNLLTHALACMLHMCCRCHWITLTGPCAFHCEVCLAKGAQLRSASPKPMVVWYCGSNPGPPLRLCCICVQRAEAAATAARLAKLQGKPLQESGGPGRPAARQQQQQLVVPPEQV